MRGLVGEPGVGAELNDAVARIRARGVPMVVAMGLAAQASAPEGSGDGEGAAITKLEQAIDLLESTGNRFIASTVRAGLLRRLAAAEEPSLALDRIRAALATC